eukprot:ANDGO_00818.mRNA.1 putative protein phosphatase 2C 32
MSSSPISIPANNSDPRIMITEQSPPIASTLSHEKSPGMQNGNGLPASTPTRLGEGNPLAERRLSARTRALQSHRSLVSRLSAPRVQPMKHPETIPSDEVLATATQMLVEYFRAAFATPITTRMLAFLVRKYAVQTLNKLAIDVLCSSPVLYQKLTDTVEEIAESSGFGVASPKSVSGFLFDFPIQDSGISRMEAAIYSTIGSRNTQEDSWQAVVHLDTLYFGDANNPVVEERRRNITSANHSFLAGTPEQFQDDPQLLEDLCSTPRRAFFGIYDGHSGPQASIFARTHLHAELAYLLHTTPDSDEATVRAIEEAYAKTDAKFCRFAEANQNEAGAVAVSLLLQNGKAYVSHAGDAMAAVVVDGVARDLGTPHKPNRSDEQERIKKAGGCVVWFGAWRVNAVLAVSRSLGDVKYKAFVPAEPETIIIDLASDEVRQAQSVYFIMASDGLWDVYSAQEAADKVKQLLAQPGISKDDVCRQLVESAVQRGSKDNVTANLLFIKHTSN